eukprot:1405989-Amphidinium_carterae.1
MVRPQPRHTAVNAATHSVVKPAFRCAKTQARKMIPAAPWMGHSSEKATTSGPPSTTNSTPLATFCASLHTTTTCSICIAAKATQKWTHTKPPVFVPHPC